MPRACCTPLENGMDITTHSGATSSRSAAPRPRAAPLEPPEQLPHLRPQRQCELQALAADFGIAPRTSSASSLRSPARHLHGSIIIDFTKCIKCGRCVQVCQEMQDVWALSFLDRGINTRMAPAGDITLAESPCVKCGQCSNHCPTGAIVENDETPAVWAALHDRTKHCVVQIAPAVRVAIGEAFGLPPGTNLTGKLYTALRRLGFKAVFDTNFSADLTIMEEASEFIERFVHKRGQLPLITSCCPSWTDFMEKNHYDFIDNFSTAKSPQQMLGVLAKTYYAEKLGIDPAKIYMSPRSCRARPRSTSSAHQGDVRLGLHRRRRGPHHPRTRPHDQAVGHRFSQPARRRGRQHPGRLHRRRHALRRHRRRDGSGAAHGLFLATGKKPEEGRTRGGARPAGREGGRSTSTALPSASPSPTAWPTSRSVLDRVREARKAGKRNALSLHRGHGVPRRLHRRRRPALRRGQRRRAGKARRRPVPGRPRPKIRYSHENPEVIRLYEGIPRPKPISPPALHKAHEPRLLPRHTR
jgi:ferredoxin